jgi:serine/threonine-protein kinase
LAADMSDREPVILNGRYELHSRIARGGMAEVYLARDQLLDRPVAIKVLFPEFAVDPSFVERFRREAQSAANLNHPSIVGVYDWGSYEGTYFIVMEYVRGRSLAEILRAEGTLHPDRAADVATDIAGALYFAHRNGVVHRDIKPGNVLIAPQGQVKVADFGIARAVGGATSENLTQTGSVMGTATYFSPEQAQGQAVDPRSDLYSLGVVLYEMLVGRPPFVGDGPVAIAYKHVQETPVSPRQVNPAVPVELEAITLKLLAKNPVNRYASAEELRADLRRYREGQPVRAERVMDPSAVAATGVMAPAAAAGRGGVTGTAAHAPTRAMTATRGAPAYGQLRGPDGTAVGGPYNGMPPETYEPPRRNGIFIAVLVVLLVVLGVLLFALAQILSDGGGSAGAQMIDVPDVTQKPVAEATQQLQALGFVVATQEQANAIVPAGQVVSQQPRAGSKAEERSTVTLFVSAAQATAPVPNVIGKSSAVATNELKQAGFTKIEAPIAVDSDKPKDEVLQQEPAGGTTVAKDTPIKLTVSKGVVTITLPDVAGKTCDQAKQDLVNAKLKPENLSCVDTTSDQVGKGKVIGTDPQGTAAADQAVKILVSSGPAKVAVPSVIGITQSNAETVLFNAGLKVKVEFEPKGDRVGIVFKQTPDPDEQVDAGSTVTITVGQSPPTTTTTERPTTTTEKSSPTTGKKNNGNNDD